MKVFVSSTCYDLIDVRSEVAEYLRQIGITPVLSDDCMSEFRVEPSKNSIESCLINLKSCDSMILILDQRYGPSLTKAGFGTYSATHLEYKTAIEQQIPVHFFARDRLLADHAIWKDNKRSDTMALSWIDYPKERPLLELIDQHQKLDANLERSNWRYSFRSSVDLKAAIGKIYESDLIQQRLTQAIQENRFPIMRATVALEDFEFTTSPASGDHAYVCRSVVKNVGGAPAFNLTAAWEDTLDVVSKPEILTQGELIAMTTKGSSEFTSYVRRKMIVNYESPLGITIRDVFEVKINFQGNSGSVGCVLESRTYQRSSFSEIPVL